MTHTLNKKVLLHINHQKNNQTQSNNQTQVPLAEWNHMNTNTIEWALLYICHKITHVYPWYPTPIISDYSSSLFHTIETAYLKMSNHSNFKNTHESITTAQYH